MKTVNPSKSFKTDMGHYEQIQTEVSLTYVFFFYVQKLPKAFCCLLVSFESYGTISSSSVSHCRVYEFDVVMFDECVKNT